MITSIKLAIIADERESRNLLHNLRISVPANIVTPAEIPATKEIMNIFVIISQEI